MNNRGRQNKTQEKSVDLSELWQILWIKRKIIAITTLVAMIGAYLGQILYVPTFYAASKVNIQTSGASSIHLAMAQLGGARVDDFLRKRIYLKYATSQEFLLEVAKEVRNHPDFALIDLQIPSSMSVLKKPFWVWFVQKYGPESPPDEAQNFLDRFWCEVLADIARAFIVSEEDLRYRIVPHTLDDESLAGFIGAIASADTDELEMIILEAKSLDPRTSVIISHVMGEVFTKTVPMKDESDVKEGKEYMRRQLAEVAEKLKKTEADLIEFKKKNGVVGRNLPKLNEVSRLRSEVELAKIGLEQNEKLLTHYRKELLQKKRVLKNNAGAPSQNYSSEVLVKLKKQLESLKYKKVILATNGYKKNSPQMKTVDAQIEKIQKLVEFHTPKAAPTFDHEEAGKNVGRLAEKVESLEANKKSLNAKLTMLNNSLTLATKRESKNLKGLPEAQQRLLAYERSLELHFELYASLRKKLQELEFQELSVKSKIKLMEIPKSAGRSSRTSFMMRFLFSSFLGFFIGVVLILSLEALDSSVKTWRDLEQLGVMVLGSIPHVERRPGQSKNRRPLICVNEFDSPESMAFKYIRAQLTRLRDRNGQPAKVFLTSSSEPGEGKTFLSANLAASFSQLNKKTLVIDCDFRSPALSEVFHLESKAGLSSLLELKAPLEQVIYSGGVENLYVIPAGPYPVNASELIERESFVALIEHLRNQYGYIILDTPPVISVVDPCVAANYADVLAFTSLYRSVKKSTVELAVKKIQQLTGGMDIYGILNNVREVHEYTSYAKYASRAPKEDPNSKKSQMISVMGVNTVEKKNDKNRRKAG